MEILNEEREEDGAYYIMEGDRRIAELIYTIVTPQRMVINHTGVSEAYKGQGLGKKLVMNLVERARAENITLIPVCRYARKVFNEDSSLKDVL